MRACFVIAEKLGRTVDELTSTMSAREFGQWMAEFALREKAAQKAAGNDPLEFFNAER